MTIGAARVVMLAASTAQADRDVGTLVQKSKFLFDRCLDLAIKKNPWLPQDMHAVWATVHIAADGHVTRVAFEGTGRAGDSMTARFAIP